jgi:hypothetical protein
MAGAKRRNPGGRSIGRRDAGTLLLLRAGTECEKNSGQSPIIPGENSPSLQRGPLDCRLTTLSGKLISDDVGGTHERSY